MQDITVAANRRGQAFASNNGTDAQWLPTQGQAQAGGTTPAFISGSTTEIPQHQRVDSSGGWRLLQTQWRFDLSGLSARGTIARLELSGSFRTGGSAASSTVVVGEANWAISDTDPTQWLNPTTATEYGRISDLTTLAADRNVSLNGAAIVALMSAIRTGGTFAVAVNAGASVDAPAFANNDADQMIAGITVPTLHIYMASNLTGVNF